MRAWLLYALIGAAILVVLVGGAWVFLDPSSRRGVLWGAGIAYAVQLVAFGLLVWGRGRLKWFLAFWVGGTLVRFGIVLAAGFALIRSGAAEGVALLLSLAGFFFILLLLESIVWAWTADNRVDG